MTETALDPNLEGAKPTVPVVLARNASYSEGVITEDNKNWQSGKIGQWEPPGELLNTRVVELFFKKNVYRS